MKVLALRNLRYVSFFNYGYEALAINELLGRKIEDFPVSVKGRGGGHTLHHVNSLLIFKPYGV
jgi:hypothetical protein